MQAKANRDLANEARKEAIASLKAAPRDACIVEVLESTLKKARRLHVLAVKEERRLFKAMNCTQIGNAAAPIDVDATSENEVCQNIRPNNDVDEKDTKQHNVPDGTDPKQRKRKRVSDSYLLYKERDDVFREWLSTVSTINLEPVDNLLLAVEELHCNILNRTFTSEIPEFVVKNLDRSIELRQDEAKRIDDADEGHEYYTSVLQNCSKCLKNCRESLVERVHTYCSDEEEVRRATKRRRLGR